MHALGRTENYRQLTASKEVIEANEDNMTVGSRPDITQERLAKRNVRVADFCIMILRAECVFLLAAAPYVQSTVRGQAEEFWSMNLATLLIVSAALGDFGGRLIANKREWVITSLRTLVLGQTPPLACVVAMLAYISAPSWQALAGGGNLLVLLLYFAMPLMHGYLVVCLSCSAQASCGFFPGQDSCAVVTQLSWLSSQMAGGRHRAVVYSCNLSIPPCCLRAAYVDRWVLWRWVGLHLQQFPRRLLLVTPPWALMEKAPMSDAKGKKRKAADSLRVRVSFQDGTDCTIVVEQQTKVTCFEGEERTTLTSLDVKWLKAELASSRGGKAVSALFMSDGDEEPLADNVTMDSLPTSGDRVLDLLAMDGVEHSVDLSLQDVRDSYGHDCTDDRLAEICSSGRVLQGIDIGRCKLLSPPGLDCLSGFAGLRELSLAGLLPLIQHHGQRWSTTDFLQRVLEVTVANTTLTKLDLSKNDAGVVGAKLVFSFLETSNSISVLQFSHNKLAGASPFLSIGGELSDVALPKCGPTSSFDDAELVQGSRLSVQDLAAHGRLTGKVVVISHRFPDGNVPQARARRRAAMGRQERQERRAAQNAPLEPAQNEALDAQNAALRNAEAAHNELQVELEAAQNAALRPAPAGGGDMGGGLKGGGKGGGFKGGGKGGGLKGGGKGGGFKGGGKGGGLKGGGKGGGFKGGGKGGVDPRREGRPVGGFEAQFFEDVGFQLDGGVGDEHMGMGLGRGRGGGMQPRVGGSHGSMRERVNQAVDAGAIGVIITSENREKPDWTPPHDTQNYVQGIKMPFRIPVMAVSFLTGTKLASAPCVSFGIRPSLAYIASCLASNSTLTSLDIANNDLFGGGLAQCTSTGPVALLRPGRDVPASQLPSGVLLRDAGMLAFVQALDTNSSLTSLDILGNSVTDVAAKLLVTAIQKSTTLRCICGTEEGSHEVNLTTRSLSHKDITLVAADVQTTSKITSLEIADNNLESAGALSIAFMLDFDVGQRLHALNLRNCNLTSLGWTALQAGCQLAGEICQPKKSVERIQERVLFGFLRFSEVLKRNTTLVKLDLACNALGDDHGCRALISALTHNDTLTSVNVLGNSIDVNQAHELIRIMQVKGKLRTLCGIIGDEVLLQFSNLGLEEGCAVLFCHELQINTALKSLNLSSNSLGNAGAELIAELFQTNMTLQTIDVSNNCIGPVGCFHLAAALETSAALSSLVLRGNQLASSCDGHLSQPDVAGFSAFCGALKINSVLSSLDLSGTGLYPEAMGVLGSALGCNSTLATIDVSANRLGMVGARYLASALEINKGLTSLTFHGEGQFYVPAGGGEPGAWKANRAVTVSCGMTEANFAGHCMKDVGVVVLCSWLKKCQNLSAIDLSGSRISEEGGECLRLTLEANCGSLSQLDVTGNCFPLSLLVAIKATCASRNISLRDEQLACDQQPRAGDRCGVVCWPGGGRCRRHLGLGIVCLNQQAPIFFGNQQNSGKPHQGAKRGLRFHTASHTELCNNKFGNTTKPSVNHARNLS
jgi:Ran GTPase-activating protein (RanGAP) involved in mRNA processing and transport